VKSSPYFFKSILVAAAALAAFAPSPLFACAACYGKSDSTLASGMNWGIFTLMGVIVTVLATIAGFFVYIIRKEAAMTNNSTPKNPTEVKV
jgi:heme/copper-type cytochrome/quinol oxidase subunit 2